MTDHVNALEQPGAGERVIRGGAVRAVGYAASVGLGAAISVVLLRYLGVVDFGRYATVMALIGVVAGITDAGLGTVGMRELSRAAPAARGIILDALLGLRLVLTPLGVGLGALVAFGLGYDAAMVAGVALAGIGLVAVNIHASLAQLLAVDLRLHALTALEVARWALTLVGVVVLAGLGASLLPFLAVQIAVGAVLIAATVAAVPDLRTRRPGWRPRTMRDLLHRAAPLALSVVMNVVYFRLLLILTSLVSTATATGLYATAFRIVEVLAGLPYALLSSALPLLSVAASEPGARAERAIVRLSETALVIGVGLAILVAGLAEPLVLLLGGSEYADAVPVLRIHAVALVPLFLSTAWTLGLVTLGRPGRVAAANAVALAIVLGGGLPLARGFGAEGAAVAAVAGELALAAGLGLALATVAGTWLVERSRLRGLALATAVGTGILFLPLPAALVGALAVLVYAVLALGLKAVPPELAEQLAGALGRWKMRS